MIADTVLGTRNHSPQTIRRTELLRYCPRSGPRETVLWERFKQIRIEKRVAERHIPEELYRKNPRTAGKTKGSEQIAFSQLFFRDVSETSG